MSDNLIHALNDLNAKMYLNAKTEEDRKLADELNAIIIKGIMEARLGNEAWA